MSKKDYQAIARAVYATHLQYKTLCPEGTLAAQVLETITHELGDVLAADNPRFSRERFIEACETGKTRGMRQVA